ncbi:MAG: alpha/beta hydrolase [Vicinamibacteria bacterium]|nr:alpha/beta hydrolase [Vicinamibacteria bacterium]
MNPSLAAWRAAGSYFVHAGQRHFVRRGGSGTPVLLIHGYPTSSWDWHRIWDSLTAHHTVIAADMLGMGFADKPRDHRYGVFDHADMHEALLRDLGVGCVHVVAHDLGVSVAQELLARQSAGASTTTIASVVFLNGGLFAECYRPRLIQRLLCSPVGGLIGPRIPRRAFDSSLRELFGPGTQPDDADLAAMWELVNHAQGRRVTHRVGRFVFDRVTHRDRLVAPLIAGVVPMRLINGSRDPNSGAHMARRYRELVPDPDVIDLAEIGHWPQLEAPGEVAAAIHEFLRLSASLK